jgi:hypothetical protein
MLRQKYQVFRTYRKSSDSRALVKGVSDVDIDVSNRWQTTLECAKGKRPNRPNRPTMRQHYAAVHLLEPAFRRYTEAM